MLREKLKRRLESASSLASDQKLQDQTSEMSNKIMPMFTTSVHFEKTFWNRFYDLECILNEGLKQLRPPASITHIYNPVEYAAELHCAYLQRFLEGSKRLLFVGMNPGPNGMGQTGVPFGNIATVRDMMQLSGRVEPPLLVHPKRPITGMKCTIEEPSGVRIWSLLQRLSGGDSLNTFAKQCFVHNFCPLAFFDNAGKNITPSELKGEYKTQIRDICLRTLDEEIKLLKPDIVVAVGEYIFSTMQRSSCKDVVKILKLPHPSPRSLNNQNWPEKAERMFQENNLLGYIKNEV